MTITDALTIVIQDFRHDKFPDEYYIAAMRVLQDAMYDGPQNFSALPRLLDVAIRSGPIHGHGK